MKDVHVIIDRPLGSRHPGYPDMLYTVNYGYVPGIAAGDGEEQDAYVLGVDEPIDSFDGEVIAVIHRRDDNEDKWVAAPRWTRFTRDEIRRATEFVEQYYDSRIEMLNEPFDFLPEESLRLTDGEICLRLSHTVQGDPEKDWVPTYHFDVCLLNGAKIGVCDLRIGHSRRLYYGGNIGYRIEAPYRGHRYAAKACRLLFELARKHDLGYAIITCDPSNTASSRTCQLAGGRYLQTAALPADNDMYRDGKREVMVYRFDL